MKKLLKILAVILSNIILGRIFRNSSHADDTYTGTAILLYIDAHVEFDQLGSNDEFNL